MAAASPGNSDDLGIAAKGKLPGSLSSEATSHDMSAMPTADPNSTGQEPSTDAVALATSQAASPQATDEQTKKWWESLVETTRDIVLVLDTDGVIRFINRTLPQLTRSDVLGSSIYDYFPSEHQAALKQTLSRVLRDAEASEAELQGMGRHNNPTWYRVRFGPIMGDATVAGVLAIATDITEEKEAATAQTSQRRMLERMFEVHERDRQLMTYEIHDGLVQDLTGALMHLESLREGLIPLDAALRPQFERGLCLIREAISEARAIIGGLRPPSIDERGILGAIDFLIGERSGIENVDIEFAHDERIDRLPPLVEGNVFRIVQEALSNIRQHSQARRARVRLKCRGDELYLEIRDWGSGFDPARVTENRVGLQGMRERAQLLRGTFSMETAPGEGTCIKVRLPTNLRSTTANQRCADDEKGTCK